MSSRRAPQPGQLGFDGLLATADTANLTRQMARETAHLPADLHDALPFYRAVIARHHAAMLAGNTDDVMTLRKEAHALAIKLNGGNAGIFADDNSPGNVLDRETRAADGTVPLWGQSGMFEITHGTMCVRIDMEGMFGISACNMPWLGFSAHAVRLDQPFLSETGFRSFVGLSGALEAGLTPDAFVAEIIAAYVKGELKGRLVKIEPGFRCVSKQLRTSFRLAAISSLPGMVYREPGKP
jgi:hypothetical protein